MAVFLLMVPHPSSLEGQEHGRTFHYRERPPAVRRSMRANVDFCGQAGDERMKDATRHTRAWRNPDQ
jgi:hypothetical protein